MSRRLKILLRIGASLALLALILLRVDVGATAASIAAAAPLLVVVVVLLHTGDRVLMAYKWHLLLRARGLPVGFGEAVRAYYLSSFAGIFLPMTVGADVVRVAAVRRASVSTSAVIASVAVERGLGALSQAVFAALAIALVVALQLDIGVSPAMVGAATVVMGALLAVGIPLSFAVARSLGTKLESSGGLVAKIGGLALEYAAWRDQPAVIRRFLVLTLIEGFFPILLYWGAAAALGVDAGLVELFAVVPLVYLIARLPVFLAGIGVEQYGFVEAADRILGMAATDAAAVSFLVLATLLAALLPGALAYILTPGEVVDPRAGGDSSTQDGE